MQESGIKAESEVKLYFGKGGAYYKCSECDIVTYSELPICGVKCGKCGSGRTVLKKINEDFKL